MHNQKWNLAIISGVILAVALACNWSTANLSSFKIAKDEAGKNEASQFGPGEKVYAVAEVSNNPGKVKVKFRLLYDDVEGEKSGELVQGAEKDFDVDGSRPLIFWVTLPPSGFKNGKYKIEAVMTDDKGTKKAEKSGTFTVSGFTSGIKPPTKDGTNTNDNTGEPTND